MPEVSVIINCFNEAKHLRETLDSVFAQTFDDWEIVFWDNASTDGSGDIALGYGEKVRQFRSDVTVPLGLARKLAYEQTRGAYIAILDADDLYLPQKLERQVALFRSDPGLGMTYCDSMYFDDDGDRFNLFSITKPHRGRVFGQMLARNFMFSSSMMFSRQALEHLGYAFDDRLVRAQDYELSLRMAYNYPIDYVDAPLCKWRMFGLGDKPWKKSLVPRVVEVKSAVENLIEMYPDIKDRYSRELQYFYKTLDYNFGVTAWEQRKGREARSYLSRHLTDKKFAFVYLCTFFFSWDLFYKLRIAYRNKTTSHS
jgi:glycosyltransferase involved in cell wall biosynthesis